MENASSGGSSRNVVPASKRSQTFGGTSATKEQHSPSELSRSQSDMRSKIINSPGTPGSPNRKQKRYQRNVSVRDHTAIFKNKLHKLKADSNNFVKKALPILKQADHSEHTEDDLHQAAVEIWSRYHHEPGKLTNLLNSPDKLSKEISSILPPLIKHRGCFENLLICRHQINVKLHQTYIGLGWEFLIMFFSLVTIANYVLETYAESNAYSSSTKLSIISIDIICNFVFATDFIVQTLTSRPWYNHVCTTDGFIDFVTVTPFIMTLSLYGLTFPTFNCRPPGSELIQLVNACAPNYAPNIDPMGIITFLRFTRILKNIRLLREARLIKIFRMIFHFDMATSRLAALGIGVLGTFTLATSIIYLVENEIENYMLAYYKMWGLPEPEAGYECYTHAYARDASCGLSWINSLYMIVVTFTTVGYGDFSPRSDFAQMVMIFILLGGVAWLSTQISRANAIIAEVPSHKKPYKLTNDAEHICVLGGFARQTLLSFLEEHFHPDHRTPGSTLEAENVVIMQPHAAPDWLKHLIVHHDHASQLHFYHGSIYSTTDLQNIQLHRAAHCFIFANVHSKNFVKDDANAVVHATALKSWTNTVKKPPPLHIQVHLESTRRRLAKLSRNGGMHDVCVDIDGLKARIFGHNFMCPGASTFLENLFTSFAGPTGVQNHKHESADGTIDEADEEWLNEYYHGCGQELYTTKAPQCLSGTLFVNAVIAVYLGHVKRDDNDTSRTPDGVIVVGVVENPHLTTSGRKVLINPGQGYRIKPHSHLMIIADDESKATALAYAHNIPSFCRAGGMVLYALSSRKRAKNAQELSSAASALGNSDVELDTLAKRNSITKVSVKMNKSSSFSGFHEKIETEAKEGRQSIDLSKVASRTDLLGQRRHSTVGRIIEGKTMFTHDAKELNADGSVVGAEAEAEEVAVHAVKSSSSPEEDVHVHVAKTSKHLKGLMERMDDMHIKISSLLPNLHLTSTGGSLNMWRRLDGINGGRLEEWPVLNDHIIICGDLRRLPEFVCAVREGIPCHLGDHEAIVEVPIVCLSRLDDLTANKLWGLTTGMHDPEVLHEVYHAKGDPSNDNDLRSCSLENASAVLILGNANHEEVKDDNERNIESSILTAYFAIQTELAFMPHKHVRVAVETQWSMAMSMLDNMRQMFHFHKKQHHRLQTSRGSPSKKKRGSINVDGTGASYDGDGGGSDDDDAEPMTTIMSEREEQELEQQRQDALRDNEDNQEANSCNCFYNMFHKHGLHHTIPKKVNHARTNFMAGPLYAAGGAISARFFDTFLCQTMFTPEVLDFLFACVSFREDHDSKGIGDRALLQLEIMDFLVGQQFQQLFSLMLKKYGLLCVGLYRSHRSRTRRTDGLPYVQTSPSPDTIIRQHDRVFVLATFPLMDKTAYLCDQYSSARDMFSNAGSYQRGREEAVTHVARVERKKSLYAMAKRASLLNKPSLMSLIAAASAEKHHGSDVISQVEKQISHAEGSLGVEELEKEGGGVVRERLQGGQLKQVNTLKL